MRARRVAYLARSHFRGPSAERTHLPLYSPSNEFITRVSESLLQVREISGKQTRLSRRCPVSARPEKTERDHSGLVRENGLNLQWSRRSHESGRRRSGSERA